MAKLTLDTIAKYDEISKINSNFDKIESELQNKVLYRNNPVGEPNTIEGDVDFNNKNVFNVNEIRASDLLIDGVNITASVVTSQTAAAASATAAASSAASASSSASAAATSASQAAAAADFIPEIANYAALRAYSGPVTEFHLKGHTSVLDGGAGIFRVDAADTTSADNGGTILVDAAGRRWKREFTSFVNVRWFGAKGDGVANDTTAITNAHSLNRPVFYQFGTYNFHGYFPECEGGIIGEGWSQNGNKTKIVFFDCTDPQRGAVKPKQSGAISSRFMIHDVMIGASSWDGSTGCLGYGVDVGAPIVMRNVYVEKFKRSNIWVHHVWPVAGSFVIGPYESLLENVTSAYSGEHGCLIGRGGNSVTLINYQGKWSGAPLFGVAPSIAGNYDGFYVADTADGNDITAYTPEAIHIVGGDCSYNSRYGWNFDVVANSGTINPGYAEDNLVKEARTGNFLNCAIQFSTLKSGIAGLLNEQVYSPYYYRNAIYYGGKRIHPVEDHSLISNPQAEDESGGTIQNAPSRKIYLSRSNTAAHTTSLQPNTTPDGTAVDVVNESVLTLRGAGTYALGLGSGSRHLKVTNNTIRLPDIFYQATATGWTAGQVARSIGSAAPTSGTWVQGDIVFNSLPTAGGFIGWVCVTSGTPGTWKTFGAITA